MIQDYTARHHRFTGCFNFRDIGGYPTASGQTVRWGRFLRAGRQDRMTAEDLETLRGMGISTQIDLRKADEIADQGRGPLPDMGAAYQNLSVIPDGGVDQLARLVGDTGISGKRYLGYLSFGPDTWLRLFDLLADAAQHPILIHCTAGKDRTGVSTAFLLSVLGVERNLIEADYLLTNLDIERQADFVEQHFGYPEGMDRALFLHHAGVPPTAMADFLDGLEERWGGALNFLRECGVTDTTFTAVRSAFLE